jgi:hypothetical protein
MNWSQLSVFKMPSKYRRYSFQPRYYDERKEALKKKIEREARLTDSPSSRDIKFKAELEQTWGNTDRKSQVLKSNLRLLVILIIIMCAVYYVFAAMDGAEEIINNALEE